MRILVASPDPSDTISWWRAWGPLCAMSGLELDSHNINGERVPWCKIERADTLFINRPHRPYHSSLIGEALTCGIGTWLDLDDHYWEVPNYNPAHDNFEEKATKRVLYDCIVQSREITVSTPTIRDYIHERLAPDASITVVPNALPDWYTWENFEHQKIILHRGSMWRFGDLLAVAPDLARLEREFPDWTLCFLGTQPWMVDVERASYQAHKPLPEYHAWLRTCRASIVIAPLIDCPFNHAKSNIAWLEASLAGAACLAPDFPEFRQPGCTPYGPGEFYDKLVWLMREADRKLLVDLSRAHIDVNFRLSVTNQLRRAVANACDIRQPAVSTETG